MMKKLTVVIVNYNVKDYAGQCLCSLRRALAGIDAQVVVVDNHSRDGSVEYLSREFPEVTVIAGRHNLGFARANNLAIADTASEYVLLLNPDTIVGETTLHEALGFMDTHADAGSLGVRMLQADGRDARESRRGLPRPVVAFYKMVGLCSRFPHSRRFARYYMGHLPWDAPARIEVVSGAFCLLRREAIDRVGLLDEDFFMYGEDIDLSYRLLKGGYHNYYLPAKILHYKGESTQHSSFRYVHVFYGAMLIFFRKHYGGMSRLLALPIKTAIYLKASLALLRMVAWHTRRMLGFTDADSSAGSHYHFIGSEAMTARCRKHAARHGLRASFTVGDRQSLPEGHLALSLSGGREAGKAAPACVVYDTDAYRYDDLFRIFSADAGHRFVMGTYSAATGKIVLPDEVMCLED